MPEGSTLVLVLGPVGVALVLGAIVRIHQLRAGGRRSRKNEGARRPEGRNGDGV